MLDLLERVAEAYQQRLVPALAQLPVGEGTVIEAAAGAEAQAARIEPHQRQEYQVEPARRDGGEAARLLDPEPIAPQGAAHLDEAHAARCPPRVDARQIDAAAAACGERDEWCAVELGRERTVNGDSLPG